MLLNSDTNSNKLVYYCVKIPIKLLLHRYTIIAVSLFTSLICLAHGVSSLYNYTRWREVSLGQVRLSESIPIGTHWAVRVDHKFWKPNWFEVDGKTMYTEMYSTTNILLSQGDTSLKGAELTNYMGLTNRTDAEINVFNDDWKLNHPNYRLTSDNCQKYAADLIVFLCGSDATKSLPWQEGAVVQTSIYSSLLAIIIGFTIYHPYWLITIFYLVVAIFVSRKEKKE